MREPEARWVLALRAQCGAESDLRFNVEAGRWEFVLPSADGIPRSQFWGWFRNPHTGQPIAVDPATGLHPFRDLDDAAMVEALANLERSFIGNPFNGAGRCDREIRQRLRFNEDLRKAKYRQAGEAFADMAWDRGRRLRGAPQVNVPIQVETRKPPRSRTVVHATP